MEEPRRTVAITDRDAVTAELERFRADGTFHTESDAASCSVGSATIEVRADGRVEGSMSLHEFGAEVETLEFDHRAGAITAESEVLSYTFRRPERTACGLYGGERPPTDEIPLSTVRPYGRP